MSEEQTYKVKYKITAESGDFSKAEIQAGKDFGGADKFLCVNMVNNDDGYSCIVFSMNELGTAFNAGEEMIAWQFITARLAQMPGVPSKVRSIAAEAHNKLNEYNQVKPDNTKLFLDSGDESVN